ncbi:MAG: PAS domain S-box protein [Nitrospirae bacterium]|nr:MAG: PAS domain S-box protein [Nitrospirota bacterium]
MQTDVSRRSYRRLPFLILLMTLVILLIGAVALHYVENRLVATTGESLALAAADIADMLDRLLFERYRDIPMMVLARVFQGRDPAAMTDYLDWVQKNYQVYRWLGVLDASGRIIAATSPASVGKDMSRTYLFRVVREQGGVHIQDVEVSEDAGGIPVISFAGPILDSQGKFRGAVLSQVALSSVQDVATAAIRTFQVQRGSTGKIEYQIMTRDGDLLVDSLLRQEMQVNLKLMALPSALLSASALPGYIEEQHLRRQVPVVTGYSGTEGYGDFTGLHWAVLVRMDRSDILAPIRTVLQNLALAGALIILPLLGFLLWTSGRLQAEYQRAREESARAVAAETTLRLRDRAIAETSNGILITDPHQPDNPIIYANPAFERITGYRMEEVLGRNCRFLQGADTDPSTVAVVRQAVAEQRDCHVVIRNYRNDGTSFWNELTISPVHDGRGQVTHFVGVLADVTARKHDEEAIERLSRQNELILNAAGEGIFGLDLQGITTFVNPAAARMLGWSVAELIGQPMHSILHHTKPDGAPHPEEECPIQAAFKKDGVVHRVADEVFWRRDGTSFPVEYVSTPIRECGDVVGAVVVFIDTTLRKEEEERRMQVEKLAALGQVAAGVAHEINNPLAGIKSAFLLLKSTIAPSHPYSQYVSMIDREIQRISDIVGQMYQLYRPDPAERRPIDLKAVLRDVSQIMAGLLRQHRLTLRTEVAANLPRVRLPQRDLIQVLCNLIRNAVEASRPASEICLSVAHGEDLVSIAVADRGNGIPAEVVPHIFDPFFTTKMGGTQGGMGLGLSVSRSLVEAMGGRIDVQTAVGRGATFTVVLPCHAAIASPSVRSKREQPHHV